MFKTETGTAIHTGIEEEARKEIAEGLARVLADTYTIYLKTHSFHWNVTGPMFQPLHQVFEEEYQELWQAVDAIAERIRALGFQAPGSYSDFIRLGSIKEETGVPPAEEMIHQLVEGHEAVARTARAVFPTADRGQDQATVELLTVRMNQHEKSAWMLRSFLEKGTINSGER